MTEPTVDPAVVADPARPDATATTQPTPSDSAVSPDTEHPAESAPPSPTFAPPAPKTVVDEPADEEGYVSAKPLLMVGAAGIDVAELGHLLAEHGYENAISRGEATPPAVLDDALMAIVIEFQQANGIDPWQPEGTDATNPPLLRQNVHQGIVDARTWEALHGEPQVTVREGARA